jgi:hypothetical protein
MVPSQFLALLTFCLLGCTQRHDPCPGLPFRSGTRSQPLLYVDEKGCPPCVRTFSGLCASYLEHDDVHIVVRATGAQLDVSSFISAGDRVIWDDGSKVAACLGLKGSSAVFFHDDGSMDTIITVSANSLTNDLDYITKRLSGEHH